MPARHAGDLAMSQAASTGMHWHAKPRNPGLETGQASDSCLQRISLSVDERRPACGLGRAGAVDAACRYQCPSQCSANHRMTGMRMAFAASGGLRSVGELAPGTDARSQRRFAHIARWIATREIIGFMWQAQPWVPMFQFDTGPRLRPRPSLQPLFELLIPVHDAWSMANWFARPHPWLSGRRPVDSCAGELAALLDVAHLEHFIATGQTQQQRPATRPACN